MYPREMPVKEVLRLVSIVRSGEVAAKKAEFAYNLWFFQGFVQRTLIGDPSDPSMNINNDLVVLTPSSVKTFENINVLDELEKLCASDNLQTQGLIDWKPILKWAIVELSKLLLD